MSVLLARGYYLLSAVRGRAYRLGALCARVKPTQSTIAGALSGEGAGTGFQGSYGHGRLRTEQDQSTKYVPFGRSWPPMITTSIPFPSNFRELTRASHILFGRERTRLVHLTDHGHPCLTVEFPDSAAPFSHTQFGAAEIRRDRSPVQNRTLV